MNILTVVAIAVLAIGGMEEITVTAVQTGWGSGGNTTKPGECPPPADMTCENTVQCNSDCECPLKQKCCRQPSCGNICQEPTVIIDDIATCGETIQPHTKPGVCPPVALDTKVCIWCYDQCKSDCECQGNQICCPTKGCGNSCTM